MLNSVRGSPVLSLLAVLFLFVEPFLIISGNDFFPRNRRNYKFEVTPLYILYTFFAPNHWAHFGCSLAIIYTIRFIEVVTSSSKIIVGIIFTSVIDLITRYILAGFSNVKITPTGPISVLVFLLFTYIILFPSVSSALFDANEKVLLIILLIIWICFAENFFVLVPVLIGFIMFTVLSPMFYPREAKEKDD